MKIGIVCEGQTDYIAIQHYVGSALRRKKITPTFIALQPSPDNTSGGGWANVITWLINHPPTQRRVFFQQGLFSTSRQAANLDLLLIQMDTDILADEAALNFLKKHGIFPVNTRSIKGKAEAITSILEHFGKLRDPRTDLKDMHIMAPISECSEAWCVAADPVFDGNPEELAGQDLCNAFGAALARSANREVKAHYASVNKRITSREQYCKKTADRIELLERCTMFRELMHKLEAHNFKLGVQLT